MDVPYTWNDFLCCDLDYYEKLVDEKERAEEKAEVPEENRRSFLDALLVNGHTIDRHISIEEDELADRLAAAPPILGVKKDFSYFFSFYDFRLAMADILSTETTSRKIMRWMASDKTQKESLGILDLDYGGYVGDGYRFENNKIIKTECENLKIVIKRDKNAMAGAMENPFYFDMKTAYPVRNANCYEDIDNGITERFAKKVIENGEKNIDNRLAWGLVLLNTEIVKIDEQNNILFDGKNNSNLREKVFGVYRMPNSDDFIGINISKRGKQEFVYGNAKTGKAYNIPRDKLAQFENEINIIAAKIRFIWSYEKFQCLVDNKVLGFSTVPEYDNEIRFLSENKWPPLTSDIDEITNREYDDNNKDTDNRITEQTKEQDDERTED